MSCIVTGVLELTIGLFWNKLRDHTAHKLKEGDPTDEKCRQLIVKPRLHCRTRPDLGLTWARPGPGMERLHLLAVGQA